MWGSEARLCSARPSAFSVSASSPYFTPAPTVTVIRSRSITTSAGRPSSETSSAESATSLNECREPSTRIRGARATISCSSSTVDGPWIRVAR
jgi:hypothetical protein